jgi:hypothetical protein
MRAAYPEALFTKWAIIFSFDGSRGPPQGDNGESQEETSPIIF